jgi:hypothetical protein
MLLLKFLGWLFVLIVFIVVYIILYAIYVNNPIDDYLGFKGENWNSYKKRIGRKNFIFETLYLDYWDNLPFMVNYVLVILNVSYLGMMFLITYSHFTGVIIGQFLIPVGSIQIACLIYIDFICKFKINSKSKTK